MKSYIILLITFLFVSAKAQEKTTIKPKWKDEETKSLSEQTTFSYDEDINVDSLLFTDVNMGISIQAIKNKNSYNLIWKEKTRASNKIEEKYLDKLSFNIPTNISCTDVYFNRCVA